MKYQCLMVDDDITIAETTAEYFNIFDIKTAYVTGYDETLKFLDENEVSLILLDINLGERSGFELCKQIRTEQSSISVWLCVKIPTILFIGIINL